MTWIQLQGLADPLQESLLAQQVEQTGSKPLG